MSQSLAGNAPSFYQRTVAWYLPPLDDGDPEQRQVAVFLVNIQLLVAAVLLARLVGLQVPGWHWLNRQELIVLSLAALFVAGLGVVRSGRLGLAAHAVLAAGWLGTTVSVVCGSGLHDAAIGGYLLVIMGAGLLRRWGAALGLLGLSLVALATLLPLQDAGVIRVAPESYGHQVRDHATILVLAAGLVWMYTRSLSDHVQRLTAELHERRRAEAELRSSEETFRTIVAAIPDALFICGPDGRFREVNEAACAQLGYTREQLLALGVQDVVVPRHAARAADRLAQIATAAPLLVESGHRRRDGSEYSVELGSAPIAYRGEQCLLAIARDLTQRQIDEAALRESEQRFRLLAGNASDVICVMEPSGEVLFISQAVERVLGGPPSDYVGRSGYGSVHPDDVPVASMAMERLLSHEVPEFYEEMRLATADGGWLWCEVRGRLMDWLDDGAPKVVTINHGIAERRAARLALQERELILRTIFEESPVVLAMVDAAGRLVEVNSAFEQAVGLSTAETIGRTAVELGLVPDAAVYDELLRQVLQDRAVEQLPMPCVLGDGRVLQGLLSARRVTLEGQPRVLVVWQDLSARVEAEQAREAAVQRLEESNAELERFTYTVSHDLKSPLITISGFVELLQADVAGGRLDRLDRSVERIQGASAHMMQLLDELLELSRIGRIANEPQTCALDELVTEAAELVAGQLTGHAVTLQVAPGLPPVYGDRPRLREVLQNLLDNACKFARPEPDRRIVVTAAVDPATDRVLLSVQDNGVGFDPAYRERIFGLFDQLDHRRGGTGIGLALVRRIVEHHGGRIWAESAGPGQGATFRLTLPQPPPGRAQPAASAQ